MLDDLARAAGISGTYTDYFGREKIVSPETKLAILASMGLETRTGRQAAKIARDLLAHRRENEDAARVREAYVPPVVESGGVWGFGLQLYSLRSRANWGIGDFGDLTRFVHTARVAGAGVVGLNPLHQLHLTNPESASPYSPLSRMHLNALYIDVDAAYKVFALGAPDATETEKEALRATTLIDYPQVARLKLAALRTLHARFTRSPNAAREQFAAFQHSGGRALRRMAVYEALTAYFKERDATAYGWLQWPAPYTAPNSAEVASFSRSSSREIEFYEFLQWVADVQLGHAARASAGMAIGLYRDLAIGVDANSVDVWSERDAYCLGISIGAPPDELNTQGQDWGLPPLNPLKLAERSFEPFVSVLRANMRYAGALRIDHVMGLKRLFLIPHGAQPSEGAYVAYPFEDLLGVLASESTRARCMIVGEDLGTVPPGFRERMARSRIFSCRLLYFERDAAGALLDPARYPRDAVASTGTHDLPPLLGFVESLPAQERSEFGQFAKLPKERVDDCEFVTATYRALAKTAAGVLLIQMEDATLRREPVNVPGTVDERPNWRQKLPIDAEALTQGVCFTALARAVSETRTRKEKR